MSEQSLYETAVSGGGFEPPRPKVRASAAVVLWRREPSGGLRVFWMRRDPAMRFMGGWHAFPGGAVSRDDAAAEESGVPAWIGGAPSGLSDREATGAMPETLTAGLDPLPPDRVPGLLSATFRELFEETGLLPAAGGAATAAREPLEQARRDLLSKRAGFGDMVESLVPEGNPGLDASRLVFAGRWLTPPFAPLRFDNRFFLLEHRPGEPEPAVPDEADAAGWVDPREALELWRRGEVITAPPILHVLRVLAEDGVEKGLPRLRRPDEVNLGPFRRIEFRPGVVMLPLATPTLPPATHTNAYLLAPPGGGASVLVDPGTPFAEEGERLEAAMEAAAAAGLPLEAIWLTHHHPDHVGAVGRLVERFRVPVAAHPATAERLEPRGIRVDRTLRDGERIALGPAGEGPGPGRLSLQVLHTPGHAPGHLCFLEEGLGSLLAGDMVSAVSTIVIDPPDGDMDDYLASLERLAGVGARTLFPGHGPAVVQAEEALRELVEHRLRREDRILEAWRSGMRDPAEMLPSVYDDAPREAWPLAQRQIEAHLRRLARAGAIEREDPKAGAGPGTTSGGAA